MSDQSVPIDTLSLRIEQKQQFHADHRAALLAFQNGEECFVWGLDQVTGELWHLDDNTAHESRTFVKERIVCPVPGCGEKLTTAHRTKKRDGLQHFAGTGGHSKESIFHSQGCALVEDWLRRTYPSSRVKREEYTNEMGERRADVLLTSPAGDRVAFEIQYSPLTSDAWQLRHDSYREQGIVDVWLFGHTRPHLALAPDGQISLNPTHEAVLKSGSPILFINPEHAMIGVSVGAARRINVATEEYEEEQIPVLDRAIRTELQLVPLTECRPSTRNGLGGEFLGALYASTAELRQFNARAEAQIAENRARAKAQRAERQRTWELRRRPQQDRIRKLLGEVERWNRSPALEAIREYFGEHLRDRIDLNSGTELAHASFVRWQCAVYFRLIAGQSKPFGAREAFNEIRKQGIKMGQPDAFKQVVRYLYRLEEDSFLHQRPGLGKYPNFVPSTSGAWW